MKKNINRYFIPLIFLGMLMMYSCEKSVETYEEFVEGGELITTGKPVSVSSQPGNKRIRFFIEINSDPKITKGFIKWEKKDGSPEKREFAVVRNTNKSRETIEVTLDNVEEGDRVYKIILGDDSGRTSIPVELTASVYGDLFTSSILPRIYSKLEFLPNDGLRISWEDPFDKMQVTRIKYMDATQTEQVLEISNDDTSTDLSSFYPKGGIVIVSDYLPDNSIDLFVSPEAKPAVLEFVLDKTAFQLAELPFDMPRLDPSVPDQEKPWDHAWDGDNSTVKVFLERNNAKPAYVTVDLGVKIRLSKLHIYGFHPWLPLSPKEYQVWGIGDDKDINTVATTIDIDDVSSLSEEDQADPVKVAAKRAENFLAWKNESLEKGWKLLIDDNKESIDSNGINSQITDETEVRYVRLVFINSFHSVNEGGNPDVGMSELTFFGQVTVD